ncbi:MAG TPA: hypothetical protein VGN86_17890 [Pyrinomonadaceae bacterium]|nr:hypothetical protein [Pyrinomonadaceae bacterium]
MAVETPQPIHSWMAEAPGREEAPGNRSLTQPVYARQAVYAATFVSQPEIRSQDASANTAKTLGITAISLMAVGLIPCLGWINYFALLLSFITVILSIVASSNAKTQAARSAATIGLVLALIAGFVGIIRLLLGGGCL